MSQICHKNVKKLCACSRYRAQHCKTQTSNSLEQTALQILSISSTPAYINFSEIPVHQCALHPWYSIRGQIFGRKVVTYNLGQNKVRNRSTPPPISMMYSRYNENAPFSIIEMGGGVVLIFHPFCPRLYVRGQRDRTKGSIIKSSFFNTFTVI